MNTSLAQQQTQSADLLKKAQTTHPVKFYCAYKTVKKDVFHMNLTKKTWIPTGILRSMYNKEKLYRNYLNHKRLLINNALDDIFKHQPKYNLKTPQNLKTDYFNPYFMQAQNDMK